MSPTLTPFSPEGFHSMAGMVLPCPSCGAEVKLLSKSSVEAVCAYCRGVLVVSTKGLELIGKLADLHEEATPLQLYATGKFEGKSFQVLGRLQMEWDQGFWSEWYAPLSDGTEAWIAEAQGFWIFTVARPEYQGRIVSDSKPGSLLKLGSDAWVVRDRKRARLSSFEGELPFKPVLGEVTESVDCAQEGKTTSFATVSWLKDKANGEQKVYVGQVLDFDSFGFAGLRTESERSATPGTGGSPTASSRKPPPFRGDQGLVRGPKRGNELVLKKSLNCANCGAAIELRAAGKSQRAVCGSCAAVLDLTTPEQKVLKAFKEKAPEPLIPLGTQGKFKGADWECIALLVREDKASEFRWREYLLFNPYKGYRFLMESAGHWNWVVMTHDPGQVVGTWVVHRGTRYRGFHRGRAHVISVVGEVYWEVAAGESVEVLDAVKPPFLVSLEVSENEENWSLSEYVQASEVARAFKITGPMPTQEGVAPNQPNPHGTADRLRKVGLWGGLTAATLMQFGACVGTPSQTHWAKTYDLLDFLGFIRDPSLVAAAPSPGPSASVSPVLATATTEAPSPAPSPAEALTHAQKLAVDITNLAAQAAGAPTPLPLIYPSPGPSLIPRYVLSEPFQIQGRPQWLDFQVQVPGLSNQWVEVEATLIDDEDGSDEAQAVLGVEYYHGYTDGESWSEGSTSGSHSFPSVDPGRYRVRIEALSSAPPTQKVVFSVQSGSISIFNYLLALTLIGVGAFVPDREKRFERKRWEESTV